MPVALSYPGVYVEEIPSGVRTITGVATSITAFLGRAVMGNVDEPVTVFSFADFERQFGGLERDYPMSYAVADFFRNGGGQAIIVRLFRRTKPDDDGIGHTKFDPDNKLQIDAASPGTWFNDIFAAVDTEGITDEIAQGLGLKKADLFNLGINQVVAGQIVPLERFTNLTVSPDASEGNSLSPVARARRIDRVLKTSQFVSVQFPKKDGVDDLTGVTIPTAGTKSRPGSGVSTDPVKRLPLRDGNAPAPAAPQQEHPADKQPGNDGAPLVAFDYAGDDLQKDKRGLYALEKADLFNLLCIPPDTLDGKIDPAVCQRAMDYCQKRRAMLIVDPDPAWTTVAAAKNGLGNLGLSGPGARNVAHYFPRVKTTDLRTGQIDTVVACGLVAGAMAATDASRGVWKAPAGLDAALVGISGLAVNLTNDENGVLNQLGINCLRNFPIYGNVIWGARTLRGADQMADEYKYIPVRRLALFIEESLFRGTQWVVFEPNDEPLWAQIRLNVGAFMHNLFVQGAFQGSTPAAAYFVKCDKETTTQNDIDLGIVNIHVGFAPLKPAEFVVLKIQQIAGNIQT
jgi:phage tail sheath protein FI